MTQLGLKRVALTRGGMGYALSPVRILRIFFEDQDLS